jgi:hypothetical protein
MTGNKMTNNKNIFYIDVADMGPKEVLAFIEMFRRRQK